MRSNVMPVCLVSWLRVDGLTHVRLGVLPSISNAIKVGLLVFIKLVLVVIHFVLSILESVSTLLGS